MYGDTTCMVGGERSRSKGRQRGPVRGYEACRGEFQNTLLTQLAHGAVRTQGTYVAALYRRLAARRGKRRAILAVAHAIMVSVLHMPTRNAPYRDLGAHYCDERRRHDTVDRLLSRIEQLGYRVHLEPMAEAAM
jgi:transposase